MNTLTLTLKKQWFDLIKSGVKTEEYREIKPYWMKRFEVDESKVNKRGLLVAKPFEQLTFTLGYPSKDDTDKRMTFKYPRIRIDYGKEEWGAEKNKLYFVITWE